MTTDLLKELAEVVPLARTAQHNDAFTLGRLTGFILTHHATIQQNAEAALRLMALEQAMSELAASEMDVHFSKFVRSDLEMRADEILRCDQASCRQNPARVEGEGR